MKKFCPLCTLIMLALTGCVFTPHTEYPESTFDLKAAATVKTQDFFILSTISNQTPARTKFYYRNTENSVQLDHYRNWVQPPELLLKRYLLNKFPYQSTAGKKPVEAKLSIIAFEFDLAASEAVLAFNYTLRNTVKKSLGNITIRQKFAQPGAAPMVEAMDKAAAAAADKLESEMKKFLTQK